MSERKFSKIRNIWDFYRTAPFGETQTVLFTPAMIYSGFQGDWFGLGVSCFSVVGGVFLTWEQFNLRRRLNESVQKFGYSDRAFNTTTEKWCDRQTARVVAERWCYLNDYKRLCFQERSMEFWFIPNF